MLSKLTRTNEFAILVILVVLSVVVGLINPAFFSISTLFDILRASVVYLILAFGVLPIIIAGGVDISFVAIAAMSSYTTHMLLLSIGYQGGVLAYYLIAGAIGILAGLLSGFLVTRFHLDIFNVSLATNTMWYGFTLFFIGATANFDFPQGAVGYYARFIATVQDPTVGTAGLHVSVIYAALIGILVWWLLNYTTLGRGVFAIGGNREVAVRSGFNVNKIFLTIFALMGLLSSVAGVTQSFLSRNFNPAMFINDPLNVLAAIVIGGAAITGGRGSIPGTVLGVLLIQVINRALILTRIPVEWQTWAVGIILIIFTSVPALRAKRAKRAGHTVELTEAGPAE